MLSTTKWLTKPRSKPYGASIALVAGKYLTGPNQSSEYHLS
ncbi:hypothetical protein [Rickettsia tamurae]|nr:hypothetical protein [Rickettsia tamurae]